MGHCSARTSRSSTWSFIVVQKMSHGHEMVRQMERHGSFHSSSAKVQRCQHIGSKNRKDELLDVLVQGQGRAGTSKQAQVTGTLVGWHVCSNGT